PTALGTKAGGVIFPSPAVGPGTLWVAAGGEG
ncbi:MAG: hypothetical protein QOF33_1190, partial [Thermomicrobiales bacterium]|nr:hypothetical protein [Thermomicrobiales bacterium]